MTFVCQSLLSRRNECGRTLGIFELRDIFIGAICLSKGLRVVLMRLDRGRKIV